MYKCVIVDDEELARKLIKNHLNQLNNFEIIASCPNAIEASKVLLEHKIDLLFLDIEMPVLNGNDFFKNLVNKPKVIFTTAYREYAIDGFELNAVDYLLKPITFSRFLKGIEKFLVTQSNTNKLIHNESPFINDNDFIFIRKDRKQIKVLLNDILYIQSIKDYIKIHLKNETHIIKHSLTAFEKLLDTRFTQIHRSYIINIDKVTAYTKQDIEINAIEIPIGNNFKEKVSELFY